MSKSETSSRRIPSLDGIRAVSIILVLYAHWGESSFGWPLLHRLPARQFDYFGSLGVSIFFVISGFLITTLLLEEKAKRSTIGLKDFYIRRILRIFPAYYVFIVALIILASVSFISVSRNDLLVTSLFLRDYSLHTSDWTNHTWSLAVEEQFYLLWPLLMLALARRHLVVICLAGIALDPIVRLVTYSKFPELRDLLPVMFHTRVDTLLVGCLLALTRFDVVSVRLRQKLAGYQAPVAAALVLGIFSPLVFERLHFSYLLTVGYTLDNFCIAFLIIWAIDHSDSAVGRFLNMRPITLIGTLSYSLYLWHVVFISPINGMTIPFVFVPFLTLAMAWLSFEFVEKRANALRRRFGSVGVVSEPMPPLLRMPRSPHASKPDAD